jgi:hypothetical protein
MKLFLCLLLTTSVILADVEIVPLSTDSDVSFVSWVGEDEMSHLGRYEGDSLALEVTTVGDYDASVGVCEFQPDSHIVLFITSTYNFYCDTLMTFSPADFSRLDSRPLYGDYEHYRYSFLKYPDSRWDAFLAVFAYSFCSSITNLYWRTMELGVSPAGEVDSLFSLSLYQYKDGGPSGNDSFSYLEFFGPVTDASNWPMLSTSEIQPGGVWPSWGGLRSVVHNPPADSTELLEACFCSASSEEPDWPPTLMALGSCSDEAVAVWEDADGVVHYSDFDCDSAEPLSSNVFPGSHPMEENWCAMSSNPGDEGILLVWYKSGSIRCRHYQDGWNDFEHVVESGIGTVNERDIAVSSVDEGYWIAYLSSGANEPELIFVDRSVVTGIENEGSSSVFPAISLDLFPNPCIGNLSIMPCGLSQTGFGRIMIHDCSGRLVREMTVENIETGHSWDCLDQYGEHCEAGVYFVTVESDQAAVTEKVLLLDQ